MTSGPEVTIRKKISHTLFHNIHSRPHQWKIAMGRYMYSLHWRYNDRGGVSGHQPHDCLLNRLFRQRTKKTSKLRVTGLCAGNSPATGEFPAQRASYAEDVSIWWRHHAMCDQSPRDFLLQSTTGWTMTWLHDDFIKWKHFPRYWSFVRGIHRSPVNSPHKGQWRRALIFSLICAWMDDWVNNREACNLRRHCAHYDVIVMDMRWSITLLSPMAVTANHVSMHMPWGPLNLFHKSIPRPTSRNTSWDLRGDPICLPWGLCIKTYMV